MIEYYTNRDLADIVFFDEKLGVYLTEQWKDIIGFEGCYKISDFGRVKSLDRLVKGKIGNRVQKGMIRKQLLDKDGYLRVGLSKNSNSKDCIVSRLVAIHFIDNPYNKPEVNHCGIMPNGKEGNKLDNRAVSLKWSTSSENSKHACKNKLQTFEGEKNNKSKLTDSDVLDIRKLLSKKTKLKHIAIQFNVSVSCVSGIKTNKMWSHLK